MMADFVLPTPQAGKRRDRDHKQSRGFDQTSSFPQACRIVVQVLQNIERKDKIERARGEWSGFQGAHHVVLLTVEIASVTRLNIEPYHAAARFQQRDEPAKTSGGTASDGYDPARPVLRQLAAKHLFENALPTPKPPMPFFEQTILLRKLSLHLSGISPNTEVNSPFSTFC
jgi:hypothetical protein